MKKIILSPSGKEVPCEEGQTVLSALEQGGYALPNNCRAGACGECKMKIKSGEIDQGFILDMALPRSERDEGYGLMCMAKIVSDSIEVEWETEDALPKLFPPREHATFLVIEKSKVTPTIVKLRLKTLGEPIRFWPGQYITLGDKDNGIPERCYSIGNIYNQEGEITLFITRIEGGKTSEWVHDVLSEGDMVRLSGAFGTFIGNPSAETPVLCLAAGSGLAPILSLATGALRRSGFKHPASILFSARTKEDLFGVGEMAYLKTKHRNFDFKYTLTREKVDGQLHGRIPDILPELHKDLSQTSIYIAGSPDFVDACVAKVKDLGAIEDLIHVEGFTSQG